MTIARIQAVVVKETSVHVLIPSDFFITGNHSMISLPLVKTKWYRQSWVRRLYRHDYRDGSTHWHCVDTAGNVYVADTGNGQIMIKYAIVVLSLLPILSLVNERHF
ncbi:MAG: hypothetical protein GY864_04420 [Desulfobacterales bacterium]|nr:hypothetical protein [Desulfobacterales bacterium]